MDLHIFQKGFNFSQDGPGNRLVYHLQGCNLCCPWCSNPEGISLVGGNVSSIDEILDEILRSRSMFFDGGGITLTGGEVTMQIVAVQELLSELKRNKIHTAIETNGINLRLQELFPFVDFLIMDCKHYDSGRHAAIVGQPNTNVILNIQRAIAAGITLALRIPLIGGFNCSESDARGFADLFDLLGVRDHATLELLRYHEFGKEKYHKLGKEYLMTDSAKVSDESFLMMQKVLKTRGFNLVRS